MIQDSRTRQCTERPRVLAQQQALSSSPHLHLEVHGRSRSALPTNKLSEIMIQKHHTVREMLREKQQETGKESPKTFRSLHPAGGAISWPEFT